MTNTMLYNRFTLEEAKWVFELALERIRNGRNIGGKEVFDQRGRGDKVGSPGEVTSVMAYVPKRFHQGYWDENKSTKGIDLAIHGLDYQIKTTAMTSTYRDYDSIMFNRNSYNRTGYKSDYHMVCAVFQQPPIINKVQPDQQYIDHVCILGRLKSSKVTSYPFREGSNKGKPDKLRDHYLVPIADLEEIPHKVYRGTKAKRPAKFKGGEIPKIQTISIPQIQTKLV